MALKGANDALQYFHVLPKFLMIRRTPDVCARPLYLLSGFKQNCPRRSGGRWEGGCIHNNKSTARKCQQHHKLLSPTLHRVGRLLLSYSGGMGQVPEYVKGPVTHYPYGEYPLVKAGEDVYGYATAHAPTAVIVQWDDGERVHSEWFPAGMVQRVSEDEWRGFPLMF